MITARSTFVIEIDATAEIPATQPTGSIEHVLSGARSDFDSGDELMRFICQALTEASASRDAGADARPSARERQAADTKQHQPHDTVGTRASSQVSSDRRGGDV
jgi:hypothetical protein